MREVPAPCPNLGNRPNLLQMRGDYWEIYYENQSAIVDDSRGLRYIALLIRHTAENRGPLHATELVALATAGNVLVELPSKETVIDAAAEKQITKRLEQIAFERNDACAGNDYDRVAALDGEVEEITAEFERLRGRGGRNKATFNNDAEKARKAVSKAIADTIAKLLALHEMEPFAKHLTDAIRKGQWLSYNGNIDWQIDFSAAPSKNSRPLPRK